MIPVQPELIQLAETSLRTACLGGAVFLILRLARVRSAAVQHAAWAICAGAMLLLPLIQLVLPPVGVPILAARSPEAISGARPVLDAIVAPVQQMEVSPAGSPSWMLWIWLGYVGVAGALMLRLMTRWIGVILLVRKAAWVRCSRALSMLPVAVPLRESDAIAVPVTTGVFRPGILLPAGWHKWDDETLRAALLHEAIHVRRRDPLMAFLSALNACVFWFHPLARWMESQIRLLCEEATDDACVAELGNRERYASVLLQMASAAGGRRTQQLWPAIAMARPSQVKRRIDRMLDGAHKGARGLSKAGWLVALVVAAPLVYSAAVIRVEHAEVRSDLTGPYRKWVDEDVIYIIAPEERVVFLGLRTDTEREQFIEQFWLRRDPTPDTPKNEAKEEHYRRIAYANERFALGVPGWQTDRGRIYITLGPPDEIESHPSGTGGETSPWEEWRYRRVGNLQRPAEYLFVDRNRDGEYTLRSGSLRPSVLIRPAPGVATYRSTVTLSVPWAELVAKPTPLGGRFLLNVYLSVFGDDPNRPVATKQETVVMPSDSGPPNPRVWIRTDLPPLPAATYRVHAVVKDVISKRMFVEDLTHTVAPK